MLFLVGGIAGYLIACAGVAKYLKAKAATKTTKQICGIAAYFVAIWPAAFLPFNRYAYLISMLVGALGYMTIVFRPKWIVGNR